MQGGTISSGVFSTSPVCGAYWINWISSFSKTTEPGVIARLRPTSKANSSTRVIRPFWRSSIKFCIPSVRLTERVSIAFRITSGLVAGKFDGLIASMNCLA